MAGISIQLKRIFHRGTVASMLEGVGYSTMTTIAPMLVVVLNLFAMYKALGADTVSYAQRELLSATILYVFIFSLLVSSPFNSVLSRFVADVIYEKQYEDVMPCFYTGLLLNVAAGAVTAVPFLVWEIFRGGVDPLFAFGSLLLFLSMILVFYGMLYLSATKDFVAISVQFLAGMALAFLLSLVLFWGLHLSLIGSIQTALTAGFMLTAVLEFSFLRGYFPVSSRNFGRVLPYFRSYWKLFVTNLAYTLGLFCHNFVFWGGEMQMKVANTFVCAQPYDMATCLAMFTNISASVITIVLIETKFHSVYQRYAEFVIGGRLSEIQKEKTRMFRRLSQLFTRLGELQFMISVVLFLLCVIFLPSLGMAGRVMTIYPCLAAAYFVVFFLYSGILLLYYLNDINGACLVSVSFLALTLAGTLVSRSLPENWYGAGLLAGAFLGWVICYLRLHLLERHFDAHVFCRGELLETRLGKMPSPVVYRRGSRLGTDAGKRRIERGISHAGGLEEQRFRRPGEIKQKNRRMPEHAAQNRKKTRGKS